MRASEGDYGDLDTEGVVPIHFSDVLECLNVHRSFALAEAESDARQVVELLYSVDDCYHILDRFGDEGIIIRVAFPGT